mmetsp:Transcript_32771/g.99024  ORF Transcript_32771/g.99024 Transcript_32771/m.99024 type:complete len:88 (+) Transcript_32771:1402-1665(+)
MAVGPLVGSLVGTDVGAGVGVDVGAAVGTAVGALVGHDEQSTGHNCRTAGWLHSVSGTTAHPVASMDTPSQNVVGAFVGLLEGAAVG